MQVPAHLLNKAIQLAKDGNQKDAGRLLAAIIEQQPENDRAWFWYIRSIETSSERLAAARAWVHHQPHSEKAREVLQYLITSTEPEKVSQKKISAMIQVNYSRLMAWALLLLAVSLAFAVVVPLYNGMTARAEALDNQVILLGNQNYENRFEYESVWIERKNLQQEFHVLTGDYNTQDHNMVEVLADFDRLKADHNQLLRDYAQLQTKYDVLNDKFDSYQGEAITPPFIAIQGRYIDVAFRKLDGTQVNWSIPFDRYELELERGIRARTGVLGMGMPILRLTHGPDQEIWVTDFRGFMDSSPFVNVMTDIYEQSPDDRTFITETWSIVGQMISYVFEEDEIPRYPLETLVSGGGDCEDTAILFASMIQAAQPDWTLELVYMNSKSPSDPMGFSDHVIVFIDTGIEHYYIETTRTDVMEPYTEGVVGWFVPLDG
jgi:hypothetical protein